MKDEVLQIRIDGRLMAKVRAAAKEEGVSEFTRRALELQLAGDAERNIRGIQFENGPQRPGGIDDNVPGS